MAVLIKDNLLKVMEKIARAARSVGRDPAEVRLVVVTKTHPIETILAAIQAGAVCLGENYAEEAVEKMTRIGPLPGVEWHMIGHVQSRKARLVAENFALVHSLDSIRLARRLDVVAVEHGKCLPVLLEVNLADEESKTGWCAADESRWGALVADFSGVAACSNLKMSGLMFMPPLSDDPEQARPYFKKGRRLQTFLKSQLPQVDWSQLSMGTSADYEAAVQEGATFVRIGTAILGKRSKMPEIG